MGAPGQVCSAAHIVAGALLAAVDCMEPSNAPPQIGDVVALPSGRRVMLTAAPYAGNPWTAQRVRDHWEVLRPGLITSRPNSFGIGLFPEQGLDEADANALVDFLNAVLPAQRNAVGSPRPGRGRRGRQA